MELLSVVTKKEKLGIEFIFRKLRAEVYRNGEVLRSWEYPDIINDYTQLTEALNSIPEAVTFKGEESSLVFSDSTVQYTLLKTPPMKPADLKLFINRKASALWEIKEPYLKGWGMLQSTKKELNIHLHLIPEHIATIFVNFCQKHVLQPAHIYTTSALAPMLVTQFGEATQGLNCIAASSGDFTYLIIGTKQTPFLIRELPISWEQGDTLSIERINREIQRTILFTKQQHNQTITRIDMIGKNSSDAAALMTFQNIETINSVNTPVPWISFALKTSPLRSENLLPRIHLGQLKRKRLTLALFFIVPVYLALSVFAYFFTQKLHDNVNASLQNADIGNEINRLVSKKNELDQRILSMNHHTQTVEMIRQKTKPPIPGWFAGFATEMLPDSLIFRRFAVQYDSGTGSWFVEIEGLSPRDPLKSAKLLKEYQDAISMNSTLFTIDSPWNIQWLENLYSGGTHESEASLKPFRIKGVIH